MLIGAPTVVGASRLRVKYRRESWHVKGHVRIFTLVCRGLLLPRTKLLVNGGTSFFFTWSLEATFSFFFSTAITLWVPFHCNRNFVKAEATILVWESIMLKYDKCPYCFKIMFLSLLIVLWLYGTCTGEPGLLNLILLTWKIGRAPNNASRWQMRFNSAFKGLKQGTPEE